MTIVLNYLSETCAISVSDRLVTVGNKPHNDVFNKAIICLLDDALVTIAFTGLAHIEGLATDRWIAKAILADRYDEKVVSSTNKRPFGVRHLNQALSRIIDSIRKAANDRRSVIREHFLEIYISGYKADKLGFLWPYGLIMRKAKKTEAISYRLLGRRATLIDSSQLPLSVSGGWAEIEPEIVNALGISLNSISASKDIPFSEQATPILVQAVRDFAKKHPEIGSEVMVIRHAPRILRSFISFESIRDHSHPLIEKLFGSYKVSYSPWIISPATYHASAVFISRGHEASIGFRNPDGTRFHYKFQITGIEQDPSLPDMFYLGPHPVGKTP